MNAQQHCLSTNKHGWNVAFEKAFKVYLIVDNLDEKAWKWHYSWLEDRLIQDTLQLIKHLFCTAVTAGCEDQAHIDTPLGSMVVSHRLRQHMIVSQIVLFLDSNSGHDRLKQSTPRVLHAQMRGILALKKSSHDNINSNKPDFLFPCYRLLP